MPAGSTYTPIATTTLGSAAASYTFTGISSSYTDIILISSLPGNQPGANLKIRVGNGSIDSGSNYSYTQLYGTGTGAASLRASNKTGMNVGVTAGTNSMQIVQFQNYSNTTTYKTVLFRGSAPSNYVDASVGLWRNTAAINQIYIADESGTNLATGSTFTLYGIKAA